MSANLAANARLFCAISFQTVVPLPDARRRACVLSPLPAWVFGKGTMGFVHDRGVRRVARLVGFREGTIYVPFDAPISRTSGDTLRDVVRHEYGHALAWARPSFVKGRWFRQTFGAPYDKESPERPEFDADEFVSECATTSAAEDFCETFMVLLRASGSTQAEQLGQGTRAKVDAVAEALATLRR